MRTWFDLAGTMMQAGAEIMSSATSQALSAVSPPSEKASTAGTTQSLLPAPAVHRPATEATFFDPAKFWAPWFAAMQPATPPAQTPFPFFPGFGPPAAQFANPAAWMQMMMPAFGRASPGLWPQPMAWPLPTGFWPAATLPGMSGTPANPWFPWLSAAPSRDPAMELLEQIQSVYRTASGYAVATILKPMAGSQPLTQPPPMWWMPSTRH